MNDIQLESQYDRFLDQLRKEVSEFYWLYNFFFLLQGSLTYGLFSGAIVEYMFLTKFIGFLMSVYWFWVAYKQKKWRDIWLDKLKDVEEALKYPSKYQMWTQDESSFFGGRKGLWKLLMYLPLGFAIMWLSIIFFT